jgi:hypothetical protein
LKSPAEPSSRFGPARLLRAAVFATLLGACLAFQGIPVRGADIPDAPTAGLLLDHFRQSIWTEPIYAEFDLREMPRRGPEHAFHGRFWGERNERGPVTRLELDVGKGGFSHRFLVQGGPDGGVWTSDAGAPGTANADAAMSPLAPGVEMAPFDILPMPYLYWLDAELVSVERIRGRPAYTFVFTPPAEFAAGNPSVRSVRAYLDTQYDALVQSEITAKDGTLSKTLSLLELRKVGDRWIPKDVDVRNEATRDKTRLSLTAVAVGIPAAPTAFDPAQLGAQLAPPPAGKLLRIPQ